MGGGGGAGAGGGKGVGRGGGGSVRSSNLKKCMKLNFNFQRGRGRYSGTIHISPHGCPTQNWWEGVKPVTDLASFTASATSILS